jgi:hypothetical protein
LSTFEHEFTIRPRPFEENIPGLIGGLMRRLRPIFVTSTWRTPAGNATGLGKRTAWPRLVVNTVERAISAPHIGISLKKEKRLVPACAPQTPAGEGT